MKSIKFEAVFGLAPGYSHNNIDVVTPADAASIWQEAARKIFEECGVYVSATTHSSTTIYHQDWGCPAGGEKTVTFSGSANPEFVKMGDYRYAVVSLVKLVKEILAQSTVTVEFWEIDHVYLS